ncbi:phosphotransferase enzyme family protein [Serinicoccus chungangensis]|uniref:phosphotransferase enzyme family protein n=1 Tax=Serinicoccus chungangensis TaxID=767452 RepID=UPI00111966A0|nr:phosphotransferase [Serinicoccus chungangensis]
MPTAYQDLDEPSQVELLRGVADRAAPRFGLAPTEVRLVLHGFNTTFRLDTPGGPVAMRVNTNSLSSAGTVQAQQAWQHAIRRDTDVLVPDPLPVDGGGYLALVRSAELGREVMVTASTWLDGEDLGTVSTPEQCRALGELMATLHEHAASWEPEGHHRFPRLTGTLFGDPDVLTAAVAQDRELAALVSAAGQRCEAAFERLADEPVVPLHADLHGGNLKWHDGRLAVFDFDDSGLGPPALDLAICAFYLRGGDDDHGPESAVRAGYAARRPLPDLATEDAEALVAARQLLLANSILASTTAGQRADAAAYLRITGDRLRHWLDTGRFTRTLPRG